MLIKVFKEVTVDVTQEEIDQKRKSGGAFINEGIMKDDTFIAYIIANNKALEAIAKNDKTKVKTSTSIDDQIDVIEPIEGGNE